MNYIKLFLFSILLLFCFSAAAFTREFGDPNAFFSFGKWMCGKTSDDSFIAWYGDGSSVAIEIKKNSNGWWLLKTGNTEKVVWSSGNTNPRSFSQHPWEKKTNDTAELPRNAELTLSHGKLQTTVTRVTGYLEIVPSDEGIITLFMDRDSVYYTSKTGKEFQYTSAGDAVTDDEAKPSPEEKSDKGKSVKKENLTGRKVKIDNIGVIYSTINRTDCLAWPNETVKTHGGSDGWADWRPKKGATGTVVSVTEHCGTNKPIAIVKINDNYVAIELDGLVYAE
ncbi:MAG: hypothetical protein JW904_05300 [Spirochaetales bacterium]|nr:hypothetical protein [Spirochaetales bacterium]